MAAPVKPQQANFKDALDASVLLVDGATPPARLAYLVGLNAGTLRALTTPYAVTALQNHLDPIDNEYWLCAQVFPPGCRGLRPIYSRSSDGDNDEQMPKTFGISETSGEISADDVVEVDSPLDLGADVWPPEPLTAVAVGGQAFEAAPSEAMDRPFELPEQLTPHVEGFGVRNACCFSGFVLRSADLAAL